MSNGPAAPSSSLTLAWNDANGPVAGYSVYVQRNDGAFKLEKDVPRSTVTLNGEPGSKARVVVVAYSSRREYGPSSPSSPQFTFPQLSAAASTPAATGSASALPTYASAASSVEPLASIAGANAAEDSVAELTGGGLVWQAGGALRLTDARLETTRMFSRPEGAQLAGVADFDADGLADLLWVDSAVLRYMPGSALRDPNAVIPLVELATLAAGEHVLGAGDFDGDGIGDVLISNADDLISALLTTPGSAPAIASLGIAASAALVGIADIDANGSDDIAWRANGSGVGLWLMDGGTLAASTDLPLPSDLGVIGLADFDGNGASELAVRNAQGEVFLVHPLEQEIVLDATDLANTLAWQSQGAVDLDSDGSEELVLASADAIRIAGLPGELVVALDPESPWQLTALLP